MAVWRDSVERLIERHRPLIAVIHISAAPFELAERLAEKRKLADRGGQASKLRPGNIGHRLRGRAGIGSMLSSENVTLFRFDVFGECLVTDAVMKIPILQLRNRSRP